MVLATYRQIGAVVINIRSLFCRHVYEYTGSSVTGVTLGWGLRPTRMFDFEYACQKCGAPKTEHGMVLPCDRDLNPSLYDELDGWPLNHITMQRLDIELVPAIRWRSPKTTGDSHS